MRDAPPLDPLFKPESVAVVGASSDPGKLGAMVFDNLVRSGFRGRIHPVGRSAGTLDGRPIRPSLAAIGAPVDLAFLMVPASGVDAALEDAAAAGVKVAIVGASGFAESGEVEAQARQKAFASRTGLRIVGPNCNGIYNAHLPLSVGFNRAHSRKLPAGGVAILSHSGALFEPLVRLLAAYGAGLSCFVSAGNEADLTVLDYADHLIEQPETRVVAMLIDALSDGPRFARLARRADALGKSLVVLKLGTSALGEAAAIAHSSRMTGSAAAYAAFFRSLGVPVATSIEGLMASAALLDRYGRREGGLATLTSSGAGGSLIADLGAHHGIRFADYADATRADLDRWKRFSVLGNPTDLGVFGDSTHWHDLFAAIARDPGAGLIMGYSHSFGGAIGAKLRAAMAGARRATGKPVVLLAPGGFEAEEVAAYAASDIPVLSESDACLQAVAAILTPRARTRADAGQDQGGFAIDLPPGEGPLSEPDSLALLARAGLPVVRALACRSVEDAVAAAGQVGWPVALKGMVAGVAHKSDLGLVRLGIRNAEELRDAAAAFGPEVALVVQPMASGELEAILGVARAPGVGLLVMAGLGGVHAEALDDVRLWLPDEPREAVLEGLDGSRLGRILSSARWPHRNTRDALADAIVALQRFARSADGRLEAVDVNPVLLNADGLVAVDAVVVRREPDPGP